MERKGRLKVEPSNGLYLRGGVGQARDDKARRDASRVLGMQGLGPFLACVQAGEK